ncbi:MAG TPA: hypothetical protein VMF51_08355 [Nocardioides sp.]|uniref:hypothetical protein n=1 Tax=Nocardioides sp. TaxID=35761 RepID=UPI002C09A6D6|nr:hypothetical protein [Nocardioides sp.]HTW15127.1 hypothetical protein [Nocardioides sp.]
MTQPPRRKSRDQAIDDVAAVLDASDDAIAQMTPAEQAEAAWHPGCGRTVAQLEAEIRAERDR